MGDITGTSNPFWNMFQGVFSLHNDGVLSEIQGGTIAPDPIPQQLTTNQITDAAVSTANAVPVLYDAGVNAITSVIPSHGTVIAYAVGIGILLILVLLVAGKLEAL